MNGLAYDASSVELRLDGERIEIGGGEFVSFESVTALAPLTATITIPFGRQLNRAERRAAERRQRRGR